MLLDDNDLIVHPTPEGAQYFYPHANLVDAGLNPEMFDIVEIGRYRYELQGHVSPTWPWPEGGFWWVESRGEVEGS